MRLKQGNLAGPAGFVSMEDGAVGGFVQRGIAAAARRGRSGGDGWCLGGRRGDARDRGFGARLLESLARTDGTVTMLAEITALNAACARALDSGRLEEWPGFFLDRCLYKVTSADNFEKGYQAGLIYADSRAMLMDRIAALREANIYERQRYRHILGMPLIEAETEGPVAVETSFLVAAETSFLVVRTMRDGQMMVFATGVYLDKVSRDEAGALRYGERIVVCDSQRIDTLLAIPL